MLNLRKPTEREFQAHMRLSDRLKKNLAGVREDIAKYKAFMLWRHGKGIEQWIGEIFPDIEPAETFDPKEISRMINSDRWQYRWGF
jgi:hypothetical protein